VDYETLWTGSGSYNANAFGAEAFNAGASFKATDEALENASQPRAVTQLTPDRFVVLPLPDSDRLYTLRLIYALKPKRSALGMPAFLMDELEDVVFHGALQELLVQPNEAWKDRELAAYHAKQFLSHVTERRARANMGNARGSMTVQMRPFA
jgi:NAD(P)H-dependent flavin oxidoreductase YrpB (nitropropane dioxygenase family)